MAPSTARSDSRLLGIVLSRVMSAGDIEDLPSQPLGQILLALKPFDPPGVASVHFRPPDSDRFGAIVAAARDYPGHSRFVRFRSDFRREAVSDFFGISTIQVQWSLFPDFSAGIGLAKSLILNGAEGGGRTPMTLRSRDFESRASASSATSAQCRRVIIVRSSRHSQMK